MKRPLRVRVSVARNITSRPLHSDQRKFDRWIADGIERPQPEVQVVGDDAVHSVRFFRTPNEQLLTIALSRDMLNID
jgi:hypothetical protein